VTQVKIKRLSYRWGYGLHTEAQDTKGNLCDDLYKYYGDTNYKNKIDKQLDDINKMLFLIVYFYWFLNINDYTKNYYIAEIYKDVMKNNTRTGGVTMDQLKEFLTPENIPLIAAAAAAAVAAVGVLIATVKDPLKQCYGGQEDRTNKGLDEHEDEAQQNLANYGSMLEAAQQITLKITPDMLSSLTVIGISKLEGEISPDEIKKAYKTAALKNHPDKGGNNESFIAVKKAYDKIIECCSSQNKIAELLQKVEQEQWFLDAIKGIKEINAQTQKNAVGIARVGEGIARMGEGIERLDQGIERVDQGIERVDQGIERVDQGIARLDQSQGEVRNDIAKVKEGNENTNEDLESIKKILSKVKSSEIKPPQATHAKFTEENHRTPLLAAGMFSPN
jgi:hypothetical protein